MYVVAEIRNLYPCLYLTSGREPVIPQRRSAANECLVEEEKNDIYGDSKKPVQYVPKVFRSGAEKAAPKPVND